MASNDSSAPAAERLGAVLEREPAGLVRRALASAIDLAFALSIGYGTRAALDAFAASHPGDPGLVAWISNHPRLAWSLTSALPAWLALSICEALPGRGGLGKRALGMCIEGPHPQGSPSFARIALRTAIKLVPWQIAALAFLFPKPWDPREALERTRFLLLLGSNLWIGIYLASAAMTRRRQSVHDLATGTVVLKVHSR